MQWQPAQTLFLSDNVREIDAATEAGVKAILVDRPGNAPVSEGDRERMEVVESLEGIKLEASSANGKAA
jgi:enolase-phosphatase E1